jgi:uncharacterized protein YjbJ (UPF0337 family)
VIIMHTAPITQKIKGKAQKVVGDIQMKTGSKARGAVNKIKGEFNDSVGGARMKAQNDREDVEHTDDTII